MKHGGKRPGAGRPLGSTKEDSLTELIMVRLSKEDRAKAERLGNGNASAGIRAALNKA